MPDRERVIEALHCRAYDDDLPCSICAYYRPDEKPVAKCDYQGLMEDAITLLKEQVAVEPIPPTDESEMWRCGNCHHQIFRCTHQRFCERCGHEVKWE